MLYYKIDVLEELKKNGYSSYRIMKGKIFGMTTVQKLRSGEMVSANVLESICRLTNLQPGDIIGYKPE